MRAAIDIHAGASHDLSAINEIYNHYVRETHVSFDVEPVTPEARQEWFDHYATSGRYRLLVACAGEQVVGYATSSPYRPRPAYETTVETSVYLAPDVTARGIGTALYRTLFDVIADEDLHRAYAGIALPNEASVALHRRFDFHEVGHFSEQGRKFGRFWDCVILERHLG